MKIEVGEYVRDKYGEIHIVYKVEKDIVYCDKPKMENPPFDTYGCRYYDNRADILKHSFNIIDLIEKGDYVNGYRVVETMENMQTGTIHLEMTSDYTNPEIGDCTIYNKDIKTILTKEQFESMEYEV